MVAQEHFIILNSVTTKFVLYEGILYCKWSLNVKNVYILILVEIENFKNELKFSSFLKLT